jgi:tRNA-splicing ligase RtcB
MEPIARNDEVSGDVRTWTRGVPVEDAAWAQIRNVAALPIVGGPVAVMPDVHLGKGAAVGTVIATTAALIPSAVGVDIGCGMVAVRTTLTASELPDSLAAIRAAIERAVPVGFAAHKVVPRLHDAIAEGAALEQRRASIVKRFARLSIMARVPKYDSSRVAHQLGSLGGGNHFIELCLDEDDRVWAMLHSGSRNVGNTIGETAIALARRRAEREQIHLPDCDLAWLPERSAEFDEYVEGLAWAQDYAALNRDVMLGFVLGALRRAFPHAVAVAETAVNCHHNYAQRETHGGQTFWITRKGAVSARDGELGIIPGSMGARSYIVRGRGNAAAYASCSPGAGRRMSRGEARRRFTRADLAAQTAGVECRKDAGVVDEIPGAYKDIDAVMAAQADLVGIVHTLKQVLCVKG